MTSRIVVGDNTPEFVVSIVPCSIQYTGDANTATFFTPSKRQRTEGGNDVETAQFRGLKLVGEKIDIGNRNGQILTSSEFIVNDPSNGTDDIMTAKQYSGIGKFSELIVYGHDIAPHLNCKWKMVGEWEKIAEAIHS